LPQLNSNEIIIIIIIQLIFSLCLPLRQQTEQKEVSGELYAQRKNAISVEYDAVQTAESVWTFCETNKFFTPVGSGLPISPAYILITITFPFLLLLLLLLLLPVPNVYRLFPS